MTILKNNPISCLLPLLNHFLSNRTLTLTKRDWLDNLLFGLSKRTQWSKWIRTRTEDEYKRWNWVGISINFAQIERRRWNEFLSEFTYNIILAAGNHFVRSNCSKNHQFFKVSECVLNFSWHFLILRFFGIIYFFPFQWAFHNTFHNFIKFFHLR